MRRRASVEVMGYVVLKLTVSFFFIARGGLGSCVEEEPVMKVPDPTV
jgi:hypothetical protein